MRRKKMTRIIFGLAIHTLFYTATGQTVEEVQQKFPGDYAVMLTHNRDTRIFFKDNLPVAESKEETELMILDDKANGMYNKYKVFHGTFDEMLSLEAYTKVPDGNKYKKMKVVDFKTQSSRSNGVFFDDTKETVFDFPSLVKGAIGTVAYKEFHKDPHLLSPFYFSSYMPVVNAKFTITVPAEMKLNYIIKNDEQKTIQVKEERKGKQIIYEFSATEIKMKDRYGDAPPRSYYEPHVIVHIASYMLDGKEVKYLSSPDDLYKWNANFLKDVNTTPDPHLTQLADSITKGSTSDLQKAKRIYEWVQDNIKYVAFEEGLEGFIPRQAANVCTKKYGDCKDMSSLITELLKLSGLKGYYTWIGTRDIPYDYTDVPLPITDNHMISTVNIGNEWIFLDGTDPNCRFGAPSKGIQGKQALVAINENEYKLIRVPELPKEANTVIDSTFLTVVPNGLKGRSSVYYKGYFGTDAYNHLQYRDSKDTKDYIKARMTKGSNKFILGNYSINDIEKDEKTLNIMAEFEIPDYGNQIANEMYINMNLDKFLSSAVIDTAKRKVAVDKDFKYSIKQFTIMDVPEGYAVNFLPENYKFENDLFGFHINYTYSGNKIIAAKEFNSSVMMLETKDFPKWNNTINELTNQYKNQIVLQKK